MSLLSNNEATRHRAPRFPGPLPDLNSKAIVGFDRASRTVATSHFPRLLPRSIPISTRWNTVTHVCGALVRVTGSSFLHTRSHTPRLPIPGLSISHVRSPCTSPEPFCSFILAAHNLPWARIMPPTLPARQPNRPFSSRNLPRQLSATLPRQFAYLGRLNLKTARNAREPVRLDRG